MIGSVSSYSTYTSTSSTASSSARSQQFQKELLSKLDSNADGSVDQDELSTALSHKSDDGILVSLSDNFSDLDSDGSGDLSSDEIAAMAPPPPPPRDQAPTTELADALLSTLDADGDGEVSSEELSNGLASAGSTADSQEIFSALDENEDGTVSLDELAASLAPPPPPPQQASSEALLSQLDADAQSSIDTSELTSAVQANRTGDSSTDQTNVSEALNRMIANLSRQYSLDDVAPVGKYLNVAT
ncbi:XopAW family type III secretion system calcium-binding effector [Pseudomonas hefeiensis]|uniref:XopAW family type III secretion system calcium-binding effector n=1 Tax=Pseudomonas hefeiensis TaxID=2738125 RepID=A0ABY9GF30_9PSED|nr:MULTISPECIES: XopAW family type III secretion system calcium-binding effector [unclassified Pseudomonas]WLH14212.1 XopAW family type III secretion system calcium-binding effector [Pseudomonas sp. FP205]WLH97269.1 XopAW family type III secretion system calcium-binding effector [Pseudomonas sp. FP53]WLI41549.1 XopAW family type III secretion system calcium-binding effector [Pseudomonas sp. FP821]